MPGIRIHRIPGRLAADAKRRSAGQHDRTVVGALLGETRPERQAEIRCRPEFYPGARGIAGRRVRRGIERRERIAAEAGIVFCRVEPGKDRDGRVLEIVADLYAIVRERRAERRRLVQAAEAEDQGAAFVAEERT